MISKRTGLVALAVLVLVCLFLVKLICGARVATRVALLLGILVIITNTISLYYEKHKCVKLGMIC